MAPDVNFDYERRERIGLGEAVFCLGKTPEQIGEAADGALAEPWGELAARVRCPVLLLHATEPLTEGGMAVTTEAQIEDARAIMPQLRYVPLRANHYTLIFGEAAERVVEEISDFRF